MASVKQTYARKQPTGRPAKGYRDSKGKRLVGVTTICKHIDGDSGGLLYWANNLGLEGKSHKEEGAKAAAEGTAIHDAVTLHCAGTPREDILAKWPEKREAIAFGMTAYDEWSEGAHMALDPHEIPLVDEALGFGGTADLLGRDRNGQLALADIKTGKLYPAAVLQVAAYGKLIEAECGEAIASYHLLRFDRMTGAFTHVGIPLPIIHDAWIGFLQCLALYQLNKRLKKML